MALGGQRRPPVLDVCFKDRPIGRPMADMGRKRLSHNLGVVRHRQSYPVEESSAASQSR